MEHVWAEQLGKNSKWLSVIIVRKSGASVLHRLFRVLRKIPRNSKSKLQTMLITAGKFYLNFFTFLRATWHIIVIFGIVHSTQTLVEIYNTWPYICEFSIFLFVKKIISLNTYNDGGMKHLYRKVTEHLYHAFVYSLLSTAFFRRFMWTPHTVAVRIP